MIASAAAGKRPDVINTFTVPDKCCRALGSNGRPRPTDNEMAKIIRLLLILSISVARTFVSEEISFSTIVLMKYCFGTMAKMFNAIYELAKKQNLFLILFQPLSIAS